MGLRSLIWNTFHGFAHSVQMNRNFRCGTILPRRTLSLNDNLKQKFNFKLLSFSPLTYLLTYILTYLPMALSPS